MAISLSSRILRRAAPRPTGSLARSLAVPGLRVSSAGKYPRSMCIARFVPLLLLGVCTFFTDTLLVSRIRAHTVARTAGRAAISAQIQFGPPPAGFDWGYCTLDSFTDPDVAAPAPPAPESVEHDVFDPRSTTQYEQKAAAVPAAALNDELSDGAMSVPNACKFMADPTLDGMSVAQKATYLASKGVDAFVIAQATCVAPEDNVQGHPELPATSSPPSPPPAVASTRVDYFAGAAVEAAASTPISPLGARPLGAEADVLVRSAGPKGMGAFAAAPIPKGTWLGNYLGELFTHEASL